MRVPDWWTFLLLAGGAFRWTRLVGWDDFPPVARARAWALGEEWPPRVPQDGPTYRRPMLAHLVHCPFCVGFWICVGTYAGWLAAPRATLFVMTPFALSAVVGLTAKNLDP